ncbi:MAG: DNA cytosine methyltransferase [Planctomycetaceae bacterium]|nr:DNA cytosine methyltransferase [Planctomycetaceae bacterium]
MRRPRSKGLVIDSFAGGGGASLGIAWAIGRAPDIAINHDPVAIEVHKTNHPSTRHVRDDVRSIDICRVVGRRRVWALWASPDCKDFSRAKGDKPVSKNIRGLAWVIVKWIEQLGDRAPNVLFLENVREFEEWGPVLPAWQCQGCDWRGTEGQVKLCRTRRRCPRCNSLRVRLTEKWLRDPTRKGLTFRRWLGRLRNLGYEVQHRVVDAADFGAPTHRRRLFLVARRDGSPIAWPELTHASPKKIADAPLFNILKPWRTAAECIDWSIPCKSIFERERPLATNTERRVAMAIKRYVLENPNPFILRYRGSHESSGVPLGDPLPTVTAGSHQSRPAGAGHALGLVVPQIAPLTHAGDRRCHPCDEPLPTITTANRGELALLAPSLVRFNGEPLDGDTRTQSLEQPLTTLDGSNRLALVSPSLIQTGFGERDGQAPRVPGLDKPLGAVVAGGGKHALVTAMLAKHNGGVVGQTIDSGLGTITARDHHSLVTANLVQLNRHCAGRGLDEPNRTVTGGGNHSGLVAASLIRMNHGDKQWNGVDEPLVTITSANHAALVYAFLIRYFNTAIGQHLTEPLYTITGKDRFGLVVVQVHGAYFYIADIGMRMLVPRELARAQGFPDTYVIERAAGRKLPKDKQTSLIGNSVSPYPAAAIVRANLMPRLANA